MPQLIICGRVTFIVPPPTWFAHLPSESKAMSRRFWDAETSEVQKLVDG